MTSSNSLLQLVNNLWGLTSKPLGYICNLNDNINSLRKAIDELKAKRGDLQAKVAHEERGGGVKRSEEVVCWLEMVQNCANRVDEILQEAEERDKIDCLGNCLPPNCWSSYELGKRVDQMLNEVRELLTKEGKFSNVTMPLPPPQVLHVSMGETVGLDMSKFNKVWKWIMDEKEVEVIGLYGTGGVGKTTFMRRIEKELMNKNNEFKVISVVVSKVVNKDKIRDVIRKRVGIKEEHWKKWSLTDQVQHLYEALSREKFLLLLDDLWAKLELAEIGVPHSSLKNGSKVVLTTRLRNVCNEMGATATSLEVQCLTAKEALKLFEKNFGKSIVDCPREIRGLAKEVAKECKGLPLALITVGRAMAGKESPGEWRDALTILKNNPHTLLGMVTEVFHILEFSYNSLNDDTRQACFLYCCLFPEDYPMIPNKLIELWIGEGLLGDIDDDVYRKWDIGEVVLGDLKRACLLESGYNISGPYVKMHDVIRDMGTWIACDHGQRDKLVVIEKEEGMHGRMISKWREAEKVSVWGKWIQNIYPIPLECSQLKTLFVRETIVGIVPTGFFNSMTVCLTVLDLSDNRNIELFPEEICDLINLLYLNLSATSIRELPEDIKKLTRLQWLLLDYISSPALIQTRAIASLPLIVFSQRKQYPNYISIGSNMVGNIDPSPLGQANEQDIIDELGHMPHLMDLSIDVSKSSAARGIFQSPNLQRCIRIVRITDCQEELTQIVISYSPTASGVFSHLKVLHLLNCRVLREMEITRANCFPSLVQVWVERCGFLDLSWLVHAPILQDLTVKDCDSMEKIIGDGIAFEELGASELFSCLQQLIIMNLPSLTSIYDKILPFPELNLLSIVECPLVRKLPVDSNSAQESLDSVWADDDELAELEWEDEATLNHFTDMQKRLAGDIELLLIK